MKEKKIYACDLEGIIAMKKIGAMLFFIFANAYAQNQSVCQSQILSQLNQWGINQPEWREREGSKFFFIGNSAYRLKSIKKGQVLSREDDFNKTEIRFNEKCQFQYKNIEKRVNDVITKNLKCHQEAFSLLAKWPKLKFEKSLSHDREIKAYYKASSGKIGQWYFVTVSDSYLTLIKKDFENLYVHEIEDQTCKVHKKIISNPITKDGFMDSDLQVFAKDKRNAAIYIWSPKMEVAIRGMKNFVSSLESRKVQYKILLDSRADLEDAKKIAKEHDLPKDIFTILNSDELIHRHVLNHFPSTILIRDGEVISTPMHGYLNKEQFDNYFYNNGL